MPGASSEYEILIPFFLFFTTFFARIDMKNTNTPYVQREFFYYNFWILQDKAMILRQHE